MTISFDLYGCYFEHKEFFDVMAKALQATGHRVGVITGEREVDANTHRKNRPHLLSQMGFTPDFMHLWGEFETITNGNVWKVKMMVQEGVAMHFDDDAAEMKKYTDLWIVKVMNSAQKGKF